MGDKIVFFPYKVEEVLLEIDVDELKKRFNTNILYNTNIELKTSNCSSEKNMEGEISNNKFIIRRLINFGYSAFPLIVRGKVFLIENKNYLKLTYRFHYLVNILMVIINLFFLIIFINDLRLELFHESYSAELSKILRPSKNKIISDFLWFFGIYLSNVVIFNSELIFVRKLVLKLITPRSRTIKPDSADMLTRI